MSVAVRARYSKSNSCPVCGGYPTQPGKDGRCWGFFGDDGRFGFCTRSEHAGGATFSDGANAYRHALEGPCECGVLHGSLPVRRLLSSLTRAPSPVPKAEQPPLDADTLNLVYRRYLQLCPLRPEHRLYFSTRGPGEQETAEAHTYGSLPKGYTEARHVVDTLISDFGIAIMRQVPGFYPGKDGRLQTHTGKKDDDAAVVVARDEQGRISALVRRTTAGPKPKYMNMAGSTNDAYTVAGAWPPTGPRQAMLVEGFHKAHMVARHSTGIMVLGMIGAHLNDAHLAALRRLRPDMIIEGLDADKYSNPNVAKQREHLHRTLYEAPWVESAGVEIVSSVWEERDGKGMDDLLSNGHMPRLRVIPRRAAAVARKPHVTPDPELLQTGRPLGEVQTETEYQINNLVKERRQRHGRVKLMQVPPGVGKSRAAAAAILKYGAAARILVATKEKAAEVADEFPQIRAVAARSKANCLNIDVVGAARGRGHDVATVVCRQCPYLADCRESGYYSQFERPGPMVGSTEFLFSATFLRGGDLLVLDDASVERAMIDTRSISSSTALQLASTEASGSTRELLVTVQSAIDGLRAETTYAAPLIGPAAWDVLAQAAGSGARFVELVRSAPDADDVVPTPGDGVTLTVEDIERAPEAVLGRLLRTLKDEVNDFASGQPFNSGLSIHPRALEVRTVREMLCDLKTGRPLLMDKAVLLLDATPVMPLYERLARGLVMEPVFRPTVELPPNVTVTQLADRFFGKSVISQRQTGDGDRRSGRDALLASLAEQRQRYPGDREAVVCAKELRDDVIAVGIAEDRVLTFFGNRGLNSIADADVLHVLGRPQAPDYTVLQLAHVLHRGEAAIAPHIAMSAKPYAGYRATDGTGRAVNVLGFTDPRVEVLFEAHREQEMIQSVHRARLYRVGSPQGDMFEPEGHTIARLTTDRRRVRLVIHTAQPIPGLRVDELIYGEADSTNKRRAVAAVERILAAHAALISEGIQPTVNALARAAKADKRTVQKVLASQEFDPVRWTPLVVVESTMRIHRAQSNSGRSTTLRERTVASGRSSPVPTAMVNPEHGGPLVAPRSTVDERPGRGGIDKRRVHGAFRVT